MRSIAVFLMLSIVVFAQPQDKRPTREHSDERDYSRGTRALASGKWDEAIATFDSIATAKGPRADGATYWKAYALFRSGKANDALSTLAQFSRDHSSSRWANDAKALEMEIKQASGQPANPDAAVDDELKLMALNSLIQASPERALPILENILKTRSDPKLRERALFVLAQSRSEQSRQIIAGIAKGGGNPDLQMKAIEYLGMHGGEANHKLLEEIYQTSADTQVKRRVLQGYMLSGQRDRLFQIAKAESSPKLRRAAIELLGVSGGRAQLAELYAAEAAPDVKQAILNGLFIAGDAKALVNIARQEKNAELRRSVVQRLSMMNKPEAREFMMEILNK
jgi:HEAT repeat protein